MSNYNTYVVKCKVCGLVSAVTVSTPCVQLYVSVRKYCTFKLHHVHVLHVPSTSLPYASMIFIQEGQSVHVQELFTDWLAEEEVITDCERYVSPHPSHTRGVWPGYEARGMYIV